MAAEETIFKTLEPEWNFQARRGTTIQHAYDQDIYFWMQVFRKSYKCLSVFQRNVAPDEKVLENRELLIWFCESTMAL